MTRVLWDTDAARRGLIALCIPVVLAVAGCAGAIDPPGPLVAPAVPQAAPRAGISDDAGARERRQLVAAFGGVYRLPAAERLLEAMVGRIAAASDLPSLTYQVTILNTPAVNAFALPSGHVYVTRGLLALASDTSEIAAVLAHEIAHVTARHAVARAALERRGALVTRVAAEVLNDAGSAGRVQDRARTTLAGFSRQQELEADEIGVRTMAKAGFDPYGAARFLVALGRNTARRAALLGSDQAPGSDLLATHPNTPERLARVTLAARQIGAPTSREGERAAYLAAIDGLMFGDDPSSGAIRGSRYINARSGIAFQAPEGFTLDQSPDAVIGVGANGRQALRFDQVELPDGQSLETFVGSGWIENVEMSTAESMTVNGLAAATATGKGKEWNFRFAAVRAGSGVQRLIYAVQGPLGEADAAFRASIATFKPIDRSDAPQPLRIATFVAGPGETAESASGRMTPLDRPLERFLLLNGLDRPGPLSAGERYKIVIE